MPPLDLRTLLDPLLVDVRRASRTLLRDRAFTLAAIGTLTLAIALNVAAFTLMQTMLVRGYPLVERNDRLVDGNAAHSAAASRTATSPTGARKRRRSMAWPTSTAGSSRCAATAAAKNDS